MAIEARTTDNPRESGDQTAARCRCALVEPLLVYYLTSLVVMLAAAFGDELVHPQPRPRATKFAGALSPCAAWDGEWYVEIARDGYSFELDRTSSVQFFPLYPLLGRAVMTVCGVGADAALLVVAHAALFGAFVLLGAYLRVRLGQASGEARLWTLVAFGLLPSTFYFRMAYSESLLVFLLLLVMYGMDRHWNIGVLAAVAGLASATRPVGIALVVPLAIHIWEMSPTRRARLWLFASAVPLSAWGLLAYMAYQQWAFGNALAFIQTRSHWHEREPAPDIATLAEKLLALDPIRNVYDPASPCFWGNWTPDGTALFSMRFANPIFFVGSVALVALGAWRRWLNRKEVSLSVALLLVPYVTLADQGCMASAARFASVVYPVYIVLGHLLARSPRYLSTLAAAVGAIFVGAYAALFVSWYSCY